MNEKELLAVLDMSKNEQWEWIEKKGLFHFRRPPNEVKCSCLAYNSISESLADLAIRLRDKVIVPHIPEAQKAMDLVWEKRKESCCWQCRDDFWIYYAKPIHWIIATLLIAKKQK